MLAQEELLKKTQSRCLICSDLCPAEMFKVGKEVYMRRLCPTHGATVAKISSDARFLWLTNPKDTQNCCSGDQCCSVSGSNVGTLGDNAKQGVGDFEKISTCFLLIDIVESCNLPCPNCYANSPLGFHKHDLQYEPFDKIVERVESFIARKGKIEVLMLSGGEPTLHPEFCKVLTWAVTKPEITGVVINTNGLKLATDGFFKQFAKTYNSFTTQGLDHKVELYLQFDGLQLAGQKELRGLDMRKVRQRVIDRSRQLSIRINLAMTVTPENLPHAWETIKFASSYGHIRAVSLQPRFQSGRLPQNLGDRINTADVINAVVGQSQGQIKAEAFTPLPCSDPNCQIVAPFIRFANKLWSLDRFFDFSRLPGYLKNRMNFSAEELTHCGCDGNVFADFLIKKTLKPHRAFVVVVKPFMDTITWDEDRIKTCCTHVLRPDGATDSFCRYYSRLPGTYYGPSSTASPFTILG